ncbi:hypothetical protein B0O99DRAFT_609437 [Bisporella sp. PMI_857]|nr:hypothetical protein B0O99DRAFT_609437 [Bisporella sp. PMI_857]
MVMPVSGQIANHQTSHPPSRTSPSNHTPRRPSYQPEQSQTPDFFVPRFPLKHDPCPGYTTYKKR